MYFEQYIFHCLSAKFNKKVNVLFDHVFPDTGYMKLGGFIDVPYAKQFIHLVGRLKKSKRVCDELANRLRQDFPEYYYRIIALFKNKQAPLIKDYYHNLNQPTERILINRYFNLRDCENNHERVTLEDNLIINSKPAPDFDISKIENAVITIQADKASCNPGDFEIFLRDVNLFKTQIDGIIKGPFSKYPDDYLYTRDISYTKYFEYLFAERSNMIDKKIVADESVQVVDSTFDWSWFETETIDKIEKQLLHLIGNPSEVHICVVPECHYKRYALVKIDDLDLQLMQLLQKPVMIKDVLTKIKSLFEFNEANDSLEDFELLIIGRIKILLQEKILKVAI